MDEDILSKIKTTQSAEIFKGELELLIKSIYLGSKEFSSVLKTQVRSYISENLNDKLSEENIDIEKYLKNLIKRIQNMPIVRLILAFEPSEYEIDRFYWFITDSCQKHILLDIGYAPDIIGGTVIIYAGKYRDFSFKNIFEEEFEKERENILKLI